MERLVVITGLSGSGKTAAANCFEDLGYFCVDNLPVELIPPFCELIQRGGEQVRFAALVIDARERRYLDQFPATLGKLRSADTPVHVVFFECSNDVLKRRFSETRRPHPLSRDVPTLELAIATEREALARLRDRADRIIDTSGFTAHQLRAFLQSSYGLSVRAEGPNLNVMSFGFKYGVPAEADLIFDVRFLPNPYFVEELRPLSGLDAEVLEYLNSHPITGEFGARLQEFIAYLIPLYAAEGKSYLTIAIGCTGGKHRSVAMAERIKGFLESRELPTASSHRDLGRE